MPERFTALRAERYLLSLELFGMRFGLDRMQRLMTVLDAPQLTCDTIHVLGTNGKSSTTRMLAAILARHGCKTGAYLSPHMQGFSERIEVAGRAVSDDAFAAAVSAAAGAADKVERTLAADDHVTQFEVLTAAAFWRLAEDGVEVAAIEAGLGGRYDATSVIKPSVQVLTNVGLEHTRWLGPTVRDIAEEKLAVVSEHGVLVTGTLEGDAADVARSTGANWLMAGRDFGVEREAADRFSVRTPGGRFDDLWMPVLGDFQRHNFALALTAAEAYLGDLDADAVRLAADSLVLPGRLEPIAANPFVLLDGAHNPSGMEVLVDSLPDVLGERPLTAVVSILDDKDAARMIELLSGLCERLVFTRASHARALSPATLESLNRQVGGPEAVSEAHPAKALAVARDLAGPDGAVLATGSLYLLGDLRQVAALEQPEIV